MGQSSPKSSSPISGLRSLRAVSLFASLVFLGVAIYVYEHFTPFTLLPVGVSLGFLTYGLFGPRQDTTSSRAQHDPRLPGLLTAGFLFAIAIAIFSLRNAYYTKPTLFYLAVAVAAAILVLRILWTDAHLTNGVFALVFGLTTFVSNQLAMARWSRGPDSVFHFRFARRIYETGLVPGVGGTETVSTQYTGFPGHHVLTASAAHVGGLPVSDTYYTIGVLGMVLVLPLVYFAARQISSVEFALLAVVVVASMDYVIYRAGHPEILAYALPLLMFVFVSALYVYRRRATPDIVLLFGLFCLALVFTHAYTAFTTLILMLSLAIGRWLFPIIEPTIARVFKLTAYERPDRGDDAESATEGSSTNAKTGGTVERAAASRLHVLSLAFVIAFVMQAIYFTDFYDTFAIVMADWVDAIILQTGAEDQAGGAGSPRFGQIPTGTFLINTIGSGLMAGLVILGMLDFLERRRPTGYVLATWLGAAGVLMVLGVISDVRWALPNRIYVIAQLTAMVFFAAGGLIYLYSHTAISPPVVGRAVAVGLVIVLVGFVFFSAASIIAGPGTSPFNDDYPHNMKTSMIESNAASEYAEANIDEEIYTSATSFPIDTDQRFDYSDAEPGTVVSINHVNLATGTALERSGLEFGSSVYVIPQEPTAGLDDTSNRIYHNGPVEFYQVRNDPQMASEQTSVTLPATITDRQS